VIKRRLPLALALTAIVALLAIDTLSAQRGGWYDLSQFRGNVKYDGKLVFVRMSYPVQTSRQQPWAHDYPDGERHFMRILTGVSNVPAHVEESNIMNFGDPEMFKFPVIYLCEPGYWFLSEQEAAQLRAYLLKGGFIIFDDFRGNHIQNLEFQMRRVYPEAPFRKLDATHPIFHSFFEIKALDPRSGYYAEMGDTEWLGVYEDNDPQKRLIAIANNNHDLGELWEFSDTGYMPVDLSNEAYKFGVNYVMYAITH